MDLHPLVLPDAEQARARGWGRHFATDPFGEGRTVAEVLAEASWRMDEQDRADAIARDPIRYISPPRRRTVLGRLLRRA